MQDWSTDFRLYESGVKVLPQNVKMRNNYAMELKSIGLREQARKQYEVKHTLGLSICVLARILMGLKSTKSP